MRLRVLAVGSKMPEWVEQGVAEYTRRMPREFSVEWLDVSLAKRGTGSADSYRRQEAESIQSKLNHDEDLIVLDVQGMEISDALPISQQGRGAMVFRTYYATAHPGSRDFS